MAQGVTPDGINPNARINATTERKLYAKVVDAILTSSTYASRLLSNGKPFNGKTFDVPIKVTDSSLGEWFTGLETLSGQASDTLIELSYAHTAFAQPVVSVMLESMANTGAEATIDLDVFKMEEAVGEAVERISNAIFSDGSGDQLLGLEAQVDDGTTASTIGGQTRSTYSNSLNGTVTASGGTLTLNKLGTLEDNARQAGLESERPTIHVTTKTVWSLYEQLLQPNVRAEYASVGYPALPLAGNSIVSSEAVLKGGAGFTALTYRGRPVIADESCGTGIWYMINERYLEWRGRTAVPSAYRGVLERVSFGSRTMEGVSAQIDMPSSAGWFYQGRQAMPYQAGMIGRIYLIGQLVGKQPRAHGKLTGITGV